MLTVGDVATGRKDIPDALQSPSREIEAIRGRDVEDFNEAVSRHGGVIEDFVDDDFSDGGGWGIRIHDLD